MKAENPCVEASSLKKLIEDYRAVLTIEGMYEVKIMENLFIRKKKEWICDKLIFIKYSLLIEQIELFPLNAFLIVFCCGDFLNFLQKNATKDEKYKVWSLAGREAF